MVLTLKELLSAWGLVIRRVKELFIFALFPNGEKEQLNFQEKFIELYFGGSKAWWIE